MIRSTSSWFHPAFLIVYIPFPAIFNVVAFTEFNWSTTILIWVLISALLISEVSVFLGIFKDIYFLFWFNTEDLVNFSPAELKS